MRLVRSANSPLFRYNHCKGNEDAEYFVEISAGGILTRGTVFSGCRGREIGHKQNTKFDRMISELTSPWSLACMITYFYWLEVRQLPGSLRGEGAGQRRPNTVAVKSLEIRRNR
jgi:hypothetical protein